MEVLLSHQHFISQTMMFDAPALHTMQSVGFPFLDTLSHVRAARKPFQPLLKVVVLLLFKIMAQILSILHPSEMYTTAEHEFLAGNMAKNDSL